MRELKIAKQITNRSASAAFEKYLQDVAESSRLSVAEEVDEFKKLESLIPEGKHLPEDFEKLDPETKKEIEEVVEKISKANLRFVISVAKQYQYTKISLPDLIEYGNIGLVKAIYRFDYTRGFKLISYAVWWIRAYILQGVAENAFIRLPANLHGELKNIERTIDNIERTQYGCLPAEEEIEGITHDQYKKYTAIALLRNIGSLDAPFGDDERTLGETIANNTESPDYLIEQSGLAQILEQRLRSGEDTKRYKRALTCALKFGLNPGGVNPDGVGIERTNEEIAEEFRKRRIYAKSKAFGEKEIFIDAEGVQKIFNRAKINLAKSVKPNGDINDNYLVKHISKSDIDISIPDIVLKASEEEIKQALNQLSEKKGTETQAKVFSLRYGIPSKFNPDGKKHTIEKIAGQIERREGSVKTTLISAIIKLEKALLQPKIIPESGSTIPSSNDIPQNKISTDLQKDASDIDYRRPLIEEALIRLEKKTTEREKGPEIFRLYYGLNDNGKAWDVEAIMGKTEKKYPALMAAKKRTEKAILGILEGVNPIKMADILKNLRKSNKVVIKKVLEEPQKHISDNKTPTEPGNNNPDINNTEKVYAESRDASEVDYWKCKIEEALTILENKIKKTIGLEVFRLYYGINPDGKVYDGHTIAKTEVKRPYTTTMRIRKDIEEKILNTIEGIDSSKLNKILENLRKSYKTTIIVDKTRDASDVKYRRSQIKKALNLLKQEQESERKKGNRKLDRCEVFNLYYFSVDPDDGKLYTAKKIAKKEGISSDGYVTRILKNTTKEIRYKLGIDSFKMNQVLKNLKKSNNVDIKQVLEEPQRKSPEAQNISQSEVPTDHQKEASIHTKITDIPDVIDLERKIKTALEELRQEIENEDGRGKSNRKRNGCDVLNLYYFSVNPDDGKLYSNDKIANQLGISAGTYVSIILKKTKTRLAEKLGIDTDTLADILKKLRESNNADIKQVLEKPEKEFPDAQNIPQSEVPTDHQKEASIHTKITDIPDVIDLERKIKTALEELRQEIENEDGRGKSNRKRNGCDVLNLYYFSVNPDDGKLYSNDKIANQLGISAGTYVSTILKKTKTRLAEKLGIDTDTLTDILKKLRERNRDDIKNILEQPRKNTENLKQ